VPLAEEATARQPLDDAPTSPAHGGVVVPAWLALGTGVPEEQGVGGERGIVGDNAATDHLVYLSAREPLAAEILLFELVIAPLR
jgi:hypothetical protein